MLLLHQSGSVKVGEVVRYTVTYTPAVDRILPSPTHLHLKIKNTSAIALRAAFVHGPYTLYVAAYPATYKPNEKFQNPRRDGVPEFEPNLKAGGSFLSQLCVPEDVRLSAGTARKSQSQEDPDMPVKSVSWIIEVASQVIFSNSAAVHYEIMLGRDDKSLSFGFPSVTGGSNGTPGQVSDHQQSQGAKDGHHNAQPRGIYSKAIKLTVDDTASLWNTPKFPGWDDDGKERSKSNNADAPVEKATESKERGERPTQSPKRVKKVHLVLLTHGLHSNLGADMLYLKESIDAAAKQARKDGQARRRKTREKNKTFVGAESLAGNSKRDAPLEESWMEDSANDMSDLDDEDEEVIVRGFSGNATKTERGIKYLGKRLAKYVLCMTYPDQPYLPVTKSAQKAFSKAMGGDGSKEQHSGHPTHSHSTIFKEGHEERVSAYKITSISFVGHSLGGLIQTYAVAYVQKHSPEFFDLIKPINFIALATPFLGLSNENPLYVKFALDFGLVGRTGQDLGLTWRPPTIARSGWGAIVGNLGDSAHKRIEGEVNPGAKPLLRILPTGPAHTALKKFRNRTVYSNVVNDGIVPLRTSCLLFLDWQGLGRVEKARRENGFVGTMAGWTWSEFTGANSSTPNRGKGPWLDEDASESENADSGLNTPTEQGQGELVPDAQQSEKVDDDSRSLKESDKHVLDSPMSSSPPETNDTESLKSAVTKNNGNPFASFFGLFKPSSSSKSHNHSPKSTRIYKRSQTLNFSNPPPDIPDRPKVTRGDSVFGESENLSAPPKTTFFEAAGDLLNPPIPSVEFLIDPSKRPRTIFHDRVYHPEDIPPPPLKRRQTTWMSRPSSSSTKSLQGTPPSCNISSSQKKQPNHQDSSISARDYDDPTHTNPDRDPQDVVDSSAMKVEEKIARAYHRDLSWRKVLVRLEPDAHNNIIVRRMFSNADGWPVVKHLVDTHFSDSYQANTRDSDEDSHERAKSSNEKPSSEGDETKVPEAKDSGSGSSDTLHPEDARKPHPLALSNAESPGTKSVAQNESWEAKDEMSLLKDVSSHRSMAMAIRPPGGVQRKDSATWSDNDFATDEDSDDDGTDPASPPVDKGKLAPASGGFNWTEAIVGRRSRSRSPNNHDLAHGGMKARTESPNVTEGGNATGKGKEQEQNQSSDSIDTIMASDAAAARSFSGEDARNSAVPPKYSGTGFEAIDSISQKVAQSMNFTGMGPGRK